MNLITFMTFAILVITILTLVFGVLAYFLYKVRESKKRIHTVDESYDEIVSKLNREYLFFRKLKSDERAETF